MRHRSEATLDDFRGPGLCEGCGKVVRNREPHHYYFSRGAGGSDIRINLVALCAAFSGGLNCHHGVHSIGKPTKDDLLRVVAEREQLEPQEIVVALVALRRWPKDKPLPEEIVRFLSSEGRMETTKKLVTRSISLPVQGCLDVEWRDFMKTLHGAWRLSTDLANWASHTLAREDVTRVPDMKELPPYKAVDLYAMAFGRLKVKAARKEGNDPLPIVLAQVGGWDGARVAAASLLRRVQRKYCKERGKPTINAGTTN